MEFANSIQIAETPLSTRDEVFGTDKGFSFA
jgi:hypothetical protein